MAENLFGLLQSTGTFIRDSHLRMSVWMEANEKEYTGHEKVRRLQKLGVTRWWAKHKSLSAVFCKNEHSGYDIKKYSLIISVLQEIGTSSDFDGNTKATARSLRDKWLKFETLMTAALYTELFELTTPTSNYLQSPNMDYLTAWEMVQTLATGLKSLREKFSQLYGNVKMFSENLNREFEENELHLRVDADFATKRIRRKKRFFKNESCSDEDEGRW